VNLVVAVCRGAAAAYDLIRSLSRDANGIGEDLDC
jgi:hypothetical protein